MNQRPEKRELLADVFNETAAADFRGALLGETLRRVRNRRRWQQTRRIVMLFFALSMLAIFILQRSAKPTVIIVIKPMVKVASPSYQLIRTTPLPASALVTTQPLVSGEIIISVASEDIVTTTRGNYRVLSDDELLALVAHRPAALIRISGDSERLVFANPADENGFPVP